MWAGRAEPAYSNLSAFSLSPRGVVGRGSVSIFGQEWSMEELRLLDRRRHIGCSARQGGVYVAQRQEHGRSAIFVRFTIGRAVLASATPRRGHFTLRSGNYIPAQKFPWIRAPRGLLNSCAAQRCRESAVCGCAGLHLLQYRSTEQTKNNLFGSVINASPRLSFCLRPNSESQHIETNALFALQHLTDNERLPRLG
jgi:hypothetical protein